MARRLLRRGRCFTCKGFSMFQEILAGIGAVTVGYLAIRHGSSAIQWAFNRVRAPSRAREDELEDLRRRLDEFSIMLHASQQPVLPFTSTIVEHSDA